MAASTLLALSRLIRSTLGSIEKSDQPLPIFTRRLLRQSLGRNVLRDTIVGNTALSLGANGTVVTMERVLSNPAFSGEGGYDRAWLLVASVIYRVASFHHPSGAAVTQQLAVNAIASGAEYELHLMLPPDDKDRCIDDVVRRLRVGREVPINSVDGAAWYSLDYAASPDSIVNVLDAYVFADPTNSLQRDRRPLSWWDVQTTPTGVELRIDPPIGSGQQIVLDAVLTVTLASGDAATINIPDERLVIEGAAARAYDLLMTRTPGQESQVYERRRADAAREYSRLAAIWKPPVSRHVQFDAPLRRRRDWSALE